MSGKFEGKVAVVTGGNSGIGLATAKRFVSEGAYVFITGRRQTQLDAAIKDIGRNVSGVQGDVANLAGLDRLYAAEKPKRAASTYYSRMPARLRSFLLSKSPKNISTGRSTRTSKDYCSRCKKLCL
jgi:NAD(P)-dependent dehydrogenase (short-subunit alcohol dehydrogenase family)